jgi:hypothetical protein
MKMFTVCNWILVHSHGFEFEETPSSLSRARNSDVSLSNSKAYERNGLWWLRLCAGLQEKVLESEASYMMLVKTEATWNRRNAWNIEFRCVERRHRLRCMIRILSMYIDCTRILLSSVYVSVCFWFTSVHWRVYIGYFSTCIKVNEHSSSAWSSSYWQKLAERSFFDASCGIYVWTSVIIPASFSQRATLLTERCEELRFCC